VVAEAPAAGGAKEIMIQTLGMMVTSEARWDEVYELARAAGNQERKVLVLLTGKGVGMIRDSRFHALCQTASVYVCRESLAEEGLGEEGAGLDTDRVVSLDKGAEIIDRSDRFLVL